MEAKANQWRRSQRRRWHHRGQGRAEQVNHWINGPRVAGASGRSGPIYNPATGVVAREVDFASVEEVNAAVRPPRGVSPLARTCISKRTEIMFRIRNLVDQHREEIAAHLTREHGKVRTDALGEVARGLENIEFATGIPHLLKGGFSEQVSSGIDVYQIRQPLGVVGGHHAVQLPGHGADVDVRQRHRVRQHVRAEAFGEGPVRIGLPGRAEEGSGPAGWRLQRRPW